LSSTNDPKRPLSPLAELETAVSQSDDTPSSAVWDPFTDIALDPAILSWERYEVGEFVGQGGMGCVYRARDRQLDRDVALKFLRRDEPDLVHRFRREAKTQAQVDHAHVCRVYEVGEIARHVYIAMQFVEGDSLIDAGEKMPLEDKVRVMAEVARAVHAAHEQDLVHRDLKPANIMVERRPEGWHPYVLDFGIARSLKDRELTRTGTVMGTLAYLSPEQARGLVNELDRRSDVYGLGATLYALLAGVPPFSHEAGVEIVWRIVHEEPGALRRHVPTIPRDLETIVMKCLEKEPHRRYQTALELALDLERMLRGEPIEARPASIIYRIGKRVRKHRTLTAVAVGATLLLAAATIVNVRTARDARHRSALAHRLSQEVRDMEHAERMSALLPLHDRSGARSHISKRMAAIQVDTSGLGGWADGPTHYALGHGHLLLREYRLALEHLQAAWNAGYREPADAYALGMAYGALYRQGLESLEQIDSGPLRSRRRRELELKFRDRALQYLRASTNDSSGSPAYLEGLIALYEGRDELALTKAEEAAFEVETLYQARQLEGTIHAARGQEAFERGDYEDAARSYDAAESAYSEALEIARSDAALREDVCGLWIRRMEIARGTGADLRSQFERAEASCRDALTIDPDSVTARNRLAHASWRFADHLGDRGEDPAVPLESAISLAREATSLDPDSLEAHYNLGCAATIQGVRKLVRGEDPRPSLGRAISSFRRALELSPTFVPAWDDLGYAHERIGKYEVQHGIDPGPSLNAAVAAYGEAISLSPAYPNAHNNLGIALLRRGVAEMATGREPSATLQNALSSFAQAVEINPNYAYAHTNIGFVHHVRARYAMRDGTDPNPAIDAARQAFASGTAINPGIAWSFPEQAQVELLEARWDMDNRRSPVVALGRADEMVARALELNRHNSEAWLAAARVELQRSRWAVDQRRSTLESIGRGLDHVDASLALNPQSAEALLVRAALLVERSASAEPGGRRGRILEEAHAILDSVLKINSFLATEVEEIRSRARSITGPP